MSKRKTFFLYFSTLIAIIDDFSGEDGAGDPDADPLLEPPRRHPQLQDQPLLHQGRHFTKLSDKGVGHVAVAPSPGSCIVGDLERFIDANKGEGDCENFVKMLMFIKSGCNKNRGVGGEIQECTPAFR